jgi:hypothetical protein
MKIFGTNILAASATRNPYLLTQTEQPRLFLSFQGTERAEGATARRVKLTPR